MINRLRRTIVVLFALSAVMLVTLAANAAAGQQVTFTYVVTNRGSAETVELEERIVSVPSDTELTVIATNLQTGETASHRINPWSLTLKRGVISGSATAGQTIRIRIVAADATTIYQHDVAMPKSPANEAFSYYVWI